MKRRINKMIFQEEIKTAILRLSLGYDIVKAHCGELKVVTKVGEGSEFIINLTIK